MADGMPVDASSKDCVNSCEICAEDGISQTIAAYCCECAQCLCNSCYQVHQRLRITKKHRCLLGERLPQLKEDVEQERSYLFCATHKEKLIDCYCVEHGDVCCSFCVLEVHKFCQNVMKLSEKANGVRQTELFPRTIEGMTSLLEHLQDFTVSRQDELLNIATQSKCAADAIDTAFELGRQQLEKLADETKKKLEQCKQHHELEVGQSLQHSENAIPELGRLIRRTNRALENADDDRTFIILTSCGKAISQYKTILDTLLEESYDMKISFIVEPDLQNLEQLGKIRCYRTCKKKVPYVAEAANFSKPKLPECDEKHHVLNNNVDDVNRNHNRFQDGSDENQYLSVKQSQSCSQLDESKEKQQTTTARRQYDRESLMRLQFSKLAIVKPKGLPNIPDIFFDKQVTLEKSALTLKTQIHRPVKPLRQCESDTDDVDIRQKVGMAAVKESPVGEFVSTGVGPSILTKASQTKDTQTLCKKAKEILKTTTAKNFQTIAPQVQSLLIDTENKLKGVINLIFEEVARAPELSAAYAYICKRLAQIKVPSDGDPENSMTFTAALLAKCQKEMKKTTSSDQLFMEKRRELSNSTDEQQQEVLRIKLETKERNAKLRSLRVTRFTGDLFNQLMFKQVFIHECLGELLLTEDPDNTECFCVLMLSAGKGLETINGRPKMDQYFKQMEKLIDEKKTSCRVRFMLQELMDLREHNWDHPFKATVDGIQRAVSKEKIHAESSTEIGSSKEIGLTNAGDAKPV